MPEPSWSFYEASGGGRVVRDEIDKELKKDTYRLAKLRGLMARIRSGQTLPRDVKSLGDGLYEGRLSLQGNEWRIFYARRDGGLVLLALHFTSKKRPTIPRAIKKARARLNEWDKRV